MAKLENAIRVFTECDFVSMLLPLFKENGIVRLNEFELKKKLYYYYLKDEYKELFQDIVPFQEMNAGDRMLNIDNGMLNFKTFGGSVAWNDLHPENLILCSGNDSLDLSFYEKYLTADGVEKIHQMAYEFGIRDRVERNSKKSLNIYACDPNRFYHLCIGNYYNSQYGWELITDGDIKNLQVNRCPSVHLQYESPVRYNLEIGLKNAISSDVEIENASYVVMQGLENENVRRLKVYTNILDLDKLNKIGDVYTKDSMTVFNEKPFVKKYYLD